MNAQQGSQPTGSLETLFRQSGWACTSKAARADLKNYGFLPLPPGTAPGDCGYAS